MKFLRVVLVVLAAVSWLSCQKKSDEGSCSQNFLTRRCQTGPRIFLHFFLWLLTSLSAAVLSVFSFQLSVFGFVLWLLVASLDVCFMLSVYVPPHFASPSGWLVLRKAVISR